MFRHKYLCAPVLLFPYNDTSSLPQYGHLTTVVAISFFSRFSFIVPYLFFDFNKIVTPPTKDAKGNDVMVFTYNGTTYAPLRALAEAYGLEVGYDGERNIATVSKQPAQTQAPIADTGYAGFEKQWTVKEKPVTNYGDEKIFTVTYSGDLSRSEFKAWWKSYDLSTIKEYAERMMAEVQSEVPGYTVTAYFSYGQYNLGSVHAESDFTGGNFDAAGVWIK